MSEYLPPLDCILSQVWNFNIPQKLKCFTWLAFYNKINTWDNLCKRGWLDPNICSLCKTAAESIDHLFVGCPFAQKVLHGLGSIFDVHVDWSDLTLSGNFISWFSKDWELLYLPIFFI